MLKPKTKTTPKYLIRLGPSVIVAIGIAYLFIVPSQQLCPKVCSCDDQNLEIACYHPLGAEGIPVTLNPSTRKITINHANTSNLGNLEIQKKLEHLNLAYNVFTKFDFADLHENVNLQSLNASHNQINDLRDNDTVNHDEFRNDPKIWKKITKFVLSELDLSYNSLTRINNSTFARLHKLVRLNLAYNNIEIMEEDALFGLNRLEYLNLAYNDLKYVPKLALKSSAEVNVNFPLTWLSRKNPSPIKHLDMRGNPLKSLEANSFDQLYLLSELLLDECSIGWIDEASFENLNDLVLLSLSGNNLKQIPSNSLIPLNKLKELRISSNIIEVLNSDDLSQLANLEQLQINDNRFRELPQGFFQKTSSLTRVEITHNPNLTTISKGSLSNLPKLTHLNLRSNSINHISYDPTYYNPQLVIDLRENSLFCDCELRWLTSWLNNFNETMTKLTPATTMTPATINSLYGLNCTGPPALSGHLVALIPKNDLECLEPSSELNVQIGYVTLMFMISLLVFISIFNYCRYQRHLFVMLKQGIVHQQYMDSVSRSQQMTMDDIKKDAQVYDSNYETVDYYHLGE